MVASAQQILAGGNYEAGAYSLRQIGSVKVYQQETLNVAGVTLKCYFDTSDPDRADKRTGIDAGVRRVVGLGYRFPNGITFYCSNVGGFQSVAFHRQIGGARKTTVLLGPSSVNTAGMVGRQGIADQVANTSKSAYCAAVVVHELGHNLHELANEGFFWDADAGGLPVVDTAMTVSQYAATNKKELVAEVFTGIAYGMTFPPAVMTMYANYHGPVPPAPLIGRHRH
jgi:hypothetical protein